MEFLHTFWNELDGAFKWFFAAIGVAFVAEATRRTFFKSKPTNETNQSQKSGNNSVSIQIGSIEKAKDE